MDTQTNSINRVLQTLGQGSFSETTYNCPELQTKDIKVQAIFTGVCRSDIDMMTGSFGPLPINMQGHEGLAKVIEIGREVEDVAVGDIVATRGEPAYADFYTVKEQEYVPVPEQHPRYIIEPVACGLNVIYQPVQAIMQRSGIKKKLLIIGSGFLAWVAYHALRYLDFQFTIDVVGNSNKDLWQSVTDLKAEPNGPYDVIIDLGNTDQAFKSGIMNHNGLLVMGVQKQITTDFGDLLWKACSIEFPSPRTHRFYECMHEAVFLIQTGKLNVDSFWTKGYNRDTEWKQAFQDGLQRPKGYNRGYISWI